jgi:hypothetical protein
MATSGSTNFSTTRDALIKYALLQIGAIGEGDTPNATQLTDGAYMLNLVVKHLQAKEGMPLWARKQTSFSLTASSSFTIGVGATVNTPRPIRIYSAFIRDTSATPDSDVKLHLLTRSEYDQLSSKEQTGSPSCFFYEPAGAQGSVSGTIYLWPKPDSASVANKTVYITYQRPFEDFDASSDEPDFPQEWYFPVMWRLAWSLGPSYGATKEDRMTWLQEAELLFQEAHGNEEGSIQFVPSRRGC